jgi:RNA polymerase sigma factor (sigma-70 family)
MSVEFGGASADDRGSAASARSSRRPALADVYDTYAAHLFDYCDALLGDPAAAANAVQDTLIAADAKSGKLRDHSRLRAWLYSIARRQCLSEPADRSGSGDLAEPEADPADGTTDFGLLDVDAEADERETLLVVTAALRGLSNADREVLDLVFRHGIDGTDLAVTLGLSTVRVRALVSGASSRFENAAAVVVMLYRGWARCRVLTTIVRDWDPAADSLTPQLLTRVTRHIGSCDRCSRSRGYTVFGPDLLTAIPLASPPAALRQRVLDAALDPEFGAYRRRVLARLGDLDKNGFPVQPKARRATLLVMAASSAAVVVLIVAAVMLYKLTSASAGDPSAGSTSAGSPAVTATGSTPASLVPDGSGRTPRHQGSPLPGLFGPSPSPGAPFLPQPTTTSPAPSPPSRHSKSPSPPPRHTKSPSPKPTKTKPSPTATPTATATPTPTASSTPSPTP